MDAQSVVVIGSGPCGAMAAHELVHQGVPVTLLESGASEPSGLLVRAGGRNLFRKTPELLNEPDYVTSGHPSTTWYRTRQPGGLSNQWTGAVPRFAPDDFSDGQRLDQRYRWPLDYEHLEPFYQRAERLLGITASGADVAQLPGGWTDYRRSLPREWERRRRRAWAKA
jgi:glucose dehydrogenase